MSTVIQVENLSKLYRLGVVGTGTLSHDLNRWWHQVRGKEDPYLKIGEENDRTKKGGGDYAWALQDINFEVKQGEVLGIIGKNGAGKSTLLKILSRVTQPTTGSVKVKGRIASLLEVGTGFHPELTGRENIFLNGAILGMSKAEIRSKFDEIVEFSGVERYIDTPVKRYSSGMYVRLAFAVAAHLEPEILIVDEVLAVGDADFQKKCMGKMQNVAGQGRTVLFVSHNMNAIQNLCASCLHLQYGKLINHGNTDEIILKYLEVYRRKSTDLQDNDKKLKIVDIVFSDEFATARSVYSLLEKIVIGVKIENSSRETENFHLILSVYNQRQQLVANFSTFYNSSGITLSPAEFIIKKLTIHSNIFLEGSYYINVALIRGTVFHPQVIYKIENLDAFSVEGGDPFGTGITPLSGVVLVDNSWD